MRAKPVEGIIRPVTEADLRAVVAIERDSFIDPWPIAWFRAAISDRDHFPGYFVENNRLAGYALSVLESNDLHLANLAVDSEYRHQGIGTVLIEDAVDFGSAQGASIVYLEVRESNRQAISLYCALDFKIERTEEDFYGDGENALILIRKIHGVV